jgi:D-alanyl-D-alanine dipeptidase
MIRSLAPVCISLLVLLSCFTLQPDPMDLVDVCEMDSTILVELAYATPNNFLGQAVYASGDRCILRRLPLNGWFGHINPCANKATA